MPASQPEPSTPLAASAVVLDTNAALDWLLFDDPAMRAWAAAIETGRWRWLVCPRMREELAHVLGRPPLAGRLLVPREALLARFDGLSRPCPTPQALPAPVLRCSDPDDQMFLDLALAQGAQLLLSQDRALLKLARRARAKGLRIARPGDLRPTDLMA